MRSNRSVFFLLSLFLVISIAAEQPIRLMNPKANWPSFFNALKAAHPIDTFIESGTYLGQTSREAAHCFECVHTIEVNREYYEQSKEFLHDQAHVSLYCGDSSKVLPDILPGLKAAGKKMLFWLDGHFMSSMIGDHDAILTEYGYTPIQHELKAIGEAGVRDAIILIDDIRLFGTSLNGSRLPLLGNGDYPLIHDVITYLRDINYTTVIYGDILFAYDARLDLSFSELVNACTLSRNYNGKNYSDEEILKAERIIAQAQKSEQEAMHQLFVDFSKQWKGWRNRSPHYNLWEGLALAQNEQFKGAVSQFLEVINLGYDHWRIYWYLAQSYFGLHDSANTKKALEEVLMRSPEFQKAKDLLPLIAG